MSRVLCAIVVLLNMPPVAAQDEPTALVIRVNGPVHLIRPGTRVRINESQMLTTGDSLSIPKQSLVVVLNKSGKTTTFTKSVRVVPSGGAEHPAVLKVFKTAQTVAEWLPSAANRLRHRSGTMSGLEPEYPRNTSLRASPDTLIWKGPARRPFTVSIRSYKTDFRLDDTVETNYYPIPNATIEPPHQYVWTVSYWDDINPPASVWFNCLSQTDLQSLIQDARSLRQVFSQDTVSLAFRLLNIRLLLAYSLNHEAEQEIQILEPLATSNDAYWELRARVEDILDYPTEALSSLKHVKTED